MPLAWVAISQAARNQVRKPRWLPCSTVPAVTETWRSHAAHWSVSRSRPSSQLLSCPQAGQRNPSGQRFSSSQRAQAASSGNRASNSGSDRGSSVISSPFMSLHATYSATGARGMSHWEGFQRLIPAEQLFTGKDLTFPIEQDNSNIRHHLARFRRRSKVTSRACHMVDGALRPCLT